MIYFAYTYMKKKTNISKSNLKWQEVLDAEEYMIMREEGTEMPNSSELNNEKREGDYYCKGCNEKLFSSNMKYNSGSGWPSFFDCNHDVFETKTDHLVGYPRTEYHCKNCGCHHGHIFDDGPEPT